MVVAEELLRELARAETGRIDVHFSDRVQALSRAELENRWGPKVRLVGTLLPAQLLSTAVVQIAHYAQTVATLFGRRARHPAQPAR